MDIPVFMHSSAAGLVKKIPGQIHSYIFDKGEPDRAQSTRPILPTPEWLMDIIGVPL